MTTKRVYSVLIEGETDAAEVLAVDSESAALQYVEAYDAGQGGR